MTGPPVIVHDWLRRRRSPWRVPTIGHRLERWYFLLLAMLCGFGTGAMWERGDRYWSAGLVATAGLALGVVSRFHR